MHRWALASLCSFAVALAGATALFAPRPAVAAQPLDGITMTMIKSPTCECCGEYAAVLRRHGIFVEVVVEEDVAATKGRWGVPASTWSCHTSELAGYAVEGHVPVAALERLVTERPDVVGIALPGMPSGSPGMPGPQTAPFDVVAFDAAGVHAFGAF